MVPTSGDEVEVCAGSDVGLSMEDTAQTDPRIASCAKGYPTMTVGAESASDCTSHGCSLAAYKLLEEYSHTRF